MVLGADVWVSLGCLCSSGHTNVVTLLSQWPKEAQKFSRSSSIVNILIQPKQPNQTKQPNPTQLNSTQSNHQGSSTWQPVLQ